MFEKKFSGIIFVISLLIAVAVYSYIFINKDRIFKRDTISPSQNDAEVVNNPIDEKTETLAALKKAIDTENYQEVGRLLGLAYEKTWMAQKEFGDLEREVYIKVDKNYFTLKNYKKSEEICTIIYNQAPTSARFLYLRVISLEALGREAFAAGDLVAAENFGMQILQMTFRLEGTNLVADIYIKKTKDAIAVGDTAAAIVALQRALRYEVSEDRKIILDNLSKKLGGVL